MWLSQKEARKRGKRWIFKENITFK